MDIAELKSKSIEELHDMAEEMSISNFSGLRKQDLIFRIEQGLLEGPTWFYAEKASSRSSPKDTDSSAARTGTTCTDPMISTSRRRRSSAFDLRTGDTVLGTGATAQGG